MDLVGFYYKKEACSSAHTFQCYALNFCPYVQNIDVYLPNNDNSQKTKTLTLTIKKQEITTQAMYVSPDIEALLRGKAISITHSECLFLA